jgi:hypothetical protein
MPRRLRNARCSVRQLVEQIDPVNRLPLRSYTHLRMQKFTLEPLSPGEIFKAGRRGHDVTWRATGRRAPVVEDGWRLVTYLDGERELAFDVIKAQPAGRSQILLLREAGEVQS